MEKEVKAKGERIKSFIEDACAEEGIELDEIIVHCLFKTGTIDVYLEDENPRFLGRLCAMVKHQFPGIEDVDTDYRFEIEFRFEI